MQVEPQRQQQQQQQPQPDNNNNLSATINPALLGNSISDSFISSSFAPNQFFYDQFLSLGNSNTNTTKVRTISIEGSSNSPVESTATPISITASNFNNPSIVPEMDGFANAHSMQDTMRAGPIPINRTGGGATGNIGSVSAATAATMAQMGAARSFGHNNSGIPGSFGTDMDQDFSPVSSYSNQQMSLNNQSFAARFGQNPQLAQLALSQSPPTSPGFQSMSLPNNHDWLYNINSPQSAALGNGIPFSEIPYSPQTDSIMSFNPDDPNLNPKQAQLIYEKRRRRRESHNAVERRRRDNINEKIQELHSMLPPHMTDPNTKPNKGSILRLSVDYIRQLKTITDKQEQRIKELEAFHGLQSSSGGGMTNNQMPSSMGMSAEQSGLSAMLASSGNDGSDNMMASHNQRQM
ncbi:hypothetical protein H4219_004911 [Mycoemilia scoparia]|uniref:BHLH domain-containing protein n=1 Tax=Mycoemilia scoparia TaxID=417184 RepID=A0A9W8DQK2_9FUNG|nr:hypothetical protein H4219_004911 [Mycoemilia scoparia]